MIELTTRARLVLRAQRAFAESPDTRTLKRELRVGNRYVIAKLARMGLVYEQGVIRDRERGRDERA
jgi:hypothetical protein